MADALLEKETLSGEDIDEIMNKAEETKQENEG